MNDFDPTKWTEIRDYWSTLIRSVFTKPQQTEEDDE